MGDVSFHISLTMMGAKTLLKARKAVKEEVLGMPIEFPKREVDGTLGECPQIKHLINSFQISKIE